MTAQCCVCGKIRSDSSWVDPSQVTFDPKEVTHGYCPRCAAKAMAEIAEYLQRQTRGVQQAGGAKVA